MVYARTVLVGAAAVVMLGCSPARPAEAPPEAARQEAAKGEARREEARLEAARAVVRREETRVISLRVLRGEARAEGVKFGGAPAGAADVVVASRLVLAGLMAPGSGATVLSSPQVMAMVGQECVVTSGDAKQGEMVFRVTVRPSKPGTTELVLSYEEGKALARTYTLGSVQLNFNEGDGAAVRVAGGEGAEPRIVLVTVDPAPAAGKAGR